MNNIKVGDKLKIYCYKHDGSLEHTSDEAIVLENNDEVLVCGNGCTRITEKDGRTHMTNEPAVLFFYKDHWFNIIGQLKNNGIYYYCNIASPFIIEEGAIKYIDYDLDLRVFPDKSYKILDKGEYKYHKSKMKYSDELDKILVHELNRLIDLNKNNHEVFSHEKLIEYSKIYEELKGKN